MRLIIKSAVRKDLRDIADYIGRDNPARADSFADELIAKIHVIAQRPLSFPMKRALGEELRSAVHHQYHIIFSVEDDTIIVKRILHGARNILDIL